MPALPLTVTFPQSDFTLPADADWKQETAVDGAVSYSWDDEKVHLEKRYRRVPGSYEVKLEVVVENVKRAQDALPVPLALENVASLFQWPDAEIPEAGFMAELVERTGALLLLDIANVHANCANHGWDPNLYLRSLPLERLAYVHIAGGVVAGGLYRDTHRHAITPEVLGLLTRLCELRPEPAVLLEWDDDFPPPAELGGQLDVILEAVAAAGRPVGAG